MASLPLRFVLVFVGVGMFLGLAVWGWGGPGPFFSHPVFVALTIATLLISLVAVFAGGGLSRGEREARENRWVIFALIAVSIAAAFIPAYTDRLDFWTIDGDAIRWFGLIVYVAGCALRIWPVFVLGNRFSGLVAIQPGHTLVTTGVYGRIRHPSYLGLLLTLLGWSLVFRSGVGLLLTLAVAWILVERMNAEERLLRSQFGAEYDAYRARTSRLIPGVY